ncbi:hypothetical protein [Metabacillus sp. FJAT-52054]|uniref:SAF domain-containing protein n=1 Tax=Metabacillus sediminis TaxID=3117746 RepID=A0ABZ2NFH4_9BACI
MKNRKKVIAIVALCGLLITCMSLTTILVLGAEKKMLNSSSIPTAKPVKKIKINAELQVESLENTINKLADIVAEVEIRSVVSEMDEPGPKTVFSANVLDVLKGDENIKDINVLQQGNSRYEFNGNRMFKPGEKYILVLKKAPDLGETVYWIRGEETQIYEVQGDSDLLRWATPYEDELKDIEKEQIIKKSLMKGKDDKQYKLIDKRLFKEKIKKIKKRV